MEEKFTVEDLREHEGKELQIAGQVFTLSIENEFPGMTFAVWRSAYFTCYADPNYEIEGVPTDIRNDEEGVIDSENHYGLVKDADAYFTIVTQVIGTLYRRVASKRLNITEAELNELIERDYFIDKLLADGFEYDPEVVGSLDDQLRDAEEAAVCADRDY